MSISNITLNNLAVRYSDDVVATLGIVGRVNMLPILLLIGLTQGVQPLLGHNFASGNIGIMKSVMKFTGGLAAWNDFRFSVFSHSKKYSKDFY
ncbi:MAG: hypothetical protein GX111_09430 [Clostridiales bacterium]|jgi:Na+-driven multidrug efflux pump|nr:hypothetical protein [Clostridiales bacterium]